jgi:hypothetical protein
METNILKNNLPKKNVQRFYWEHNGENESIAHLGVMRKAIVIRKTFLSKNKYIISPASFFPFPEKLYCKRFETKEEAINIASEYFRSWFTDAINNML